MTQPHSAGRTAHPSSGPPGAEVTATAAVLQRLRQWRVIPVVTVHDAADAAPLASALSEGGLPCAEFTLRVPAGLTSLERAAGLEGFTLGAGTVLTAAQTRQAVDAGAQFIVSPGLSAEVVAAGEAAGVPVLPGVVTATEIMSALGLGLKLVKFFPAATSGGPAALRALASAFPGLGFMPTGGITPDSLADYLTVPAVAAVGGTWITPEPMVAARNFAAITKLAQAAVTAATTASREQGQPA